MAEIVAPSVVGDGLREMLGQRVRQVWMDWAREQPDPQSLWQTPWDELTEPEREVDRRIGEALYTIGVRAEIIAERGSIRDPVLAALYVEHGPPSEADIRRGDLL